MKKLFLPLICIMAFAISCASAEKGTAIVLDQMEQEIILESKLPESVEIIEEEAFEGTALIKVEIPEKVASIGERVFAGIASLCEIRIPLSTKYIASSAFDGSDKARIIAPANSYARAYARKYGLQFSPIVMFCASSQLFQNYTYSINGASEIAETDNKTNLNREIQWRKFEEVTITRTDELIANHVQGRSPPMA